MALFLAAPLAQGLLATAIRTAGSKAVQPYVTALVQRGAGKKAATSIAKEYVKTVGKANKTGSFPLIDKAATKNITNALNNTQRSELQRKGLLASEAPAATTSNFIAKQRMLGSSQRAKPVETLDLLRRSPTGQIGGTPTRTTGVGSTRYNIGAEQNIPVYGTRTGGEITRIPFPQARITNQFPVPAGGVSPLEQIAARSALGNQRAAAVSQRGRTMPGSQRIMSPLGAITTTGLLGSAATLPMMFGGEQPQPVIANAVGAPQVAQVPQEQLPRFGQVLRPSSESTSKEIINAALLRAGLTLLRGGTGTEALESAASVADSQTTYRTGAQALKAGQEALGKDAKISIYQRSDGSFGYQGTTQDTSSTDNSFFGAEGQRNNITKQQYDELVRTIKAKYPNATDQDIKDTLESKNIIYTGE